MLPIFSILLSFLLLGCGSPLLEEAEAPHSSSHRKKIETIKFKNKNLEAVLFWVKGPFGDPSQESSFLLHLFDQSGAPKDLNEKNLGLFTLMPSMGHGPADYGRFRKISEGIYLYEGLYFNMSGVWQMIIELYEQNKLIDDTSFSILIKLN